MLLLPNRVLVADKNLKTIFENFEQGIHQFFQIKMMAPANDFYPKEYFVMVIGRWLDSFSPESSDPSAWKKNGPEEYFILDKREHMSKLAFSKKEFGGAHLWRERRVSSDFLCFSDDLVFAIKESGLRLPKYFRMQEI